MAHYFNRSFCITRSAAKPLFFHIKNNNNTSKGHYEKTKRLKFLVIKVIRNHEALIHQLTIEVSGHRLTNVSQQSKNRASRYTNETICKMNKFK